MKRNGGDAEVRKKGWKEKEQEFFAKLSAEQREWVRRRVKLVFEGDIEDEVTLIPREGLIELFQQWKKVEGKKVLSLNDTGLLRTFVWQIAMKIRAREYEKINGNMRSVWYGHVEPLYVEKNLLESDVALTPGALSLLMPEVLDEILKVELPGVSEGMRRLKEIVERGARGMRGLGKREREVCRRVSKAAREQYITNTTTGVFDDFVKAGVFRFKEEFAFLDPREGWATIGENRPRVIFYTEKEGLWWLCQHLSKKYKITVIASQGEPSLLAMEYFVRRLKKKVKSVAVGALTDYDPWGFQIAESFEEKLKEGIFFGKDNVDFVKLNGTQKDLERLFTPEEIARGKRDLRLYSQYKQAQVNNWMKETDGIKGEPYGIHVDLAKRDRLKAVAEAWVESVNGGESSRRGPRRRTTR
ncbi:MAG: hypothetical protein RDU59_12165 [Thermodesulfobacteriota bacterium]|nr:hypothetical protein [Thermodesulfobacteriota bacterium]